MSDLIDVEPTAQTIDAAARELRIRADSLDRIAARMRERNDISYASEALSEIISLAHATRCDLLVARPIRALQK